MLFILTAPSEANVMATIRSRCCCLFIPCPVAEEVCGVSEEALSKGA